MPANLEERGRGMLLGLVLGGAMGRIVEPLDWDAIRASYGPRGLLDPSGAARPVDDTAMALAVAEALIDAAHSGAGPLMQAVLRRYVGLLRGGARESLEESTTTEALRRMAAGSPGTASRLPWSKESAVACVGLPVGFVFEAHPVLERDVSAMIASATHGHPTAAAAAVTVACCLGQTLRGVGPADWMPLILRRLDGSCCGEMLEVLRELGAAVADDDDVRTIESLGEGWTAEEAVVMAIAALARHPASFEDAVRCAVNHGGKSSSVGGLAGALAGAGHGSSGIPPSWLSWLGDTGDLDTLARGLLDARGRLG